MPRQWRRLITTFQQAPQECLWPWPLPASLHRVFVSLDAHSLVYGDAYYVLIVLRLLELDQPWFMTVYYSTPSTAFFYMFIYSSTNVFLDWTLVTFSSIFLGFYLDALFCSLSFLVLSWNRSQVPGLDDSKPLLPRSHLGPRTSTTYSSHPFLSPFFFFFWLSFISVFIYLCVPRVRKNLVKVNSPLWSPGSFFGFNYLLNSSSVVSLFFLWLEHVSGLILMLGS